MPKHEIHSVYGGQHAPVYPHYTDVKMMDINSLLMEFSLMKVPLREATKLK